MLVFFQKSFFYWFSIFFLATQSFSYERIEVPNVAINQQRGLTRVIQDGPNVTVITVGATATIGSLTQNENGRAVTLSEKEVVLFNDNPGSQKMYFSHPNVDIYQTSFCGNKIAFLGQHDDRDVLWIAKIDYRRKKVDFLTELLSSISKERKFTSISFSMDCRLTLSSHSMNAEESSNLIHIWSFFSHDFEFVYDQAQMPFLKNQCTQLKNLNYTTVEIPEISSIKLAFFAPSSSKIVAASSHEVVILDSQTFERIGGRILPKNEHLMSWPQFDSLEKRLTLVTQQTTEYGAAVYRLRNWVFDPPAAYNQERRVLAFRCPIHSAAFKNQNTLYVSEPSGKIFEIASWLPKNAIDPCDPNQEKRFREDMALEFGPDEFKGP